jgi:hypothetical protein
MSVGVHAGAVAAAAAMAQATKASGVIVQIEPDDFLRILTQSAEPLVIHSTGGFFTKKNMYLTSYRGFAFFTRCVEDIPLPQQCQLIEAQKIWVPE